MRTVSRSVNKSVEEKIADLERGAKMSEELDACKSRQKSLENAKEEVMVQLVICQGTNDKLKRQNAALHAKNDELVQQLAKQTAEAQSKQSESVSPSPNNEETANKSQATYTHVHRIPDVRFAAAHARCVARLEAKLELTEQEMSRREAAYQTEIQNMDRKIAHLKNQVDSAKHGLKMFVYDLR